MVLGSESVRAHALGMVNQGGEKLALASSPSNRSVPGRYNQLSSTSLSCAVPLSINAWARLRLSALMLPTFSTWTVSRIISPPRPKKKSILVESIFKKNLKMRALQDLKVFLRTVDAGSLSAAARAMDITPSAASASLKRLEAELNTTLFIRSTRSLRLTTEGAVFVEHARLALKTLGEGQLAISNGCQQVQGVLRLAASSDMGRNVLLPWLDEFQAIYPRIRYRLSLSDRISNMFTEPVDAAFRHGIPVDSSMVALPVAPTNRRLLVASPDYVQRHGAPITPNDLTAHACLCFMLNGEVNDKWHFSREGAALTVGVRGGHVTNDGDVVHRWALSGQGIAYKAWLDVAYDLEQGRLQQLCPDWSTEPVPLYMMIPSRHQITPALRLLREFVQQKCAQLRTPEVATKDDGILPSSNIDI